MPKEETRHQLSFHVEDLHDMLELPESAVIRDVVFTDLNHGMLTCFYVDPESTEPTPAGTESIMPRKPSHLVDH